MKVDSFRYFVLTYSCKDVNGYRRSGSIGVIARDIKSAIYIGEKHINVYGDVVIWNISHHGEVHAIDQHAMDLLIHE